jgi:hypothetical protein
MMATMSLDPPPAPPEDVGPRRAPVSLTRLARAVANDHRLILLSAAVGGLALVVSLMSEWQVTVMDSAVVGEGGFGGPIPTRIADLGAWGTGYLTGLFPLAAGMVVLLFGPPAGRTYARLAVLSTCGVLLALLAGLAADLNLRSRALANGFMFQTDTVGVDPSYGRGIWCAAFGVAAVTCAAYLSGRPWRRPRPDRSTTDDLAPDGPFDLTVTPTTPFTPPADPRQHPR